MSAILPLEAEGPHHNNSFFEKNNMAKHCHSPPLYKLHPNRPCLPLPPNPPPSTRHTMSNAPGLALPNELLVEIAFYLTEYSTAQHHVLSVSSLSALSLVSRRIRHAVLPQLFRAIPVVKQAQLHTLPNLPPHLLRHCRSVLSITVNHYTSHHPHR